MGRVFFGETIASLQPSRPRPPIVRTVALSSRYLYYPAGVTYRAWSACRRVRRISPWRSGENNGRTFYYQIDLWISNRVPTTEVYTAASGPVMLYPSLRAQTSRRYSARHAWERRICLSFHAANWRGRSTWKRTLVLFAYFGETCCTRRCVLWPASWTATATLNYSGWL